MCNECSMPACDAETLVLCEDHLRILILKTIGRFLKLEADMATVAINDKMEGA